MIYSTTLTVLDRAMTLLPAKAEVTQAKLATISIPDTVDTPIGTLQFSDGRPTDDTVATACDRPDRMRGMQVCPDTAGAVPMSAVRTGLADPMAAGANRIALFADPPNSETMVVTANRFRFCARNCADLAEDRSTVIDIPPGMTGFLKGDLQRYEKDTS